MKHYSSDSHINTPVANIAVMQLRLHPYLVDLGETGAILVTSAQMKKSAIIVKTRSGNLVTRTTLPRELALSLVQYGWVDPISDGDLKKYRLSLSGRQMLQRITAAQENNALIPDNEENLEDISTPSASHQYRRPKDQAETPVLALSRRKDKNGKPFLSRELIRAGDRLREDFESAHAGQSTFSIWQSFLNNPSLSDLKTAPRTYSGTAAIRFQSALDELGPGLGHIALLCCCFQNGLEKAEKKMGWSARSAKIVLKIALERLHRHYSRLGDQGELIG